MNESLARSLDAFTERVRARLDVGARTYGDASYTRPESELVDEIQQELEDVAGWSVLLWHRLARLRLPLATPDRNEGKLRVSSVAVIDASLAEQRSGLLGWVSCLLNEAVVVDGIALRRTADGRHALSFPARTDRHGNRHPYVRPVDSDARCAIEAQIFAALGIEQEASR